MWVTLELTDDGGVATALAVGALGLCIESDSSGLWSFGGGSLVEHCVPIL